MNCPDCNTEITGYDLIIQKRLEERQIYQSFKCRGCKTLASRIITAPTEKQIHDFLLSHRS